MDLETHVEAPVMALDIGTRTVIGIVGYPEGNFFRVLDVECRAYPQRAMIDGQIEDVLLVAQLVHQVKEALEERLGFALTQAHIAAAGRALITCNANYETSSDTPRLFGEREIRELEMGAMQQAYQTIGDDGSNFYCVGYSVVRYLLDNYPFSTLVDHRGCMARVEILATFLPAEVVDSLYAVMAKADLEVASLTLEPIAAMNAIIPPELRIVNLALVDIGAGTSDIAISRDGSVTAYGMVTVAGDEITEELIRNYLVEFDVAEHLKEELGKRENVTFTNILGFEETFPSVEVLQKVSPAAETLCRVVCDKILELNCGDAPSAVFLVGGGSKLPGLRELTAQRLGVDPKKIAVGENNYMKRLILSEEKLSGPEFVTPVGIAVTAAKYGGGGFVVSVNGQDVRLLKNSGASVLDVLFACGYKYQQIIGRSGKALQYEFNGKPAASRGGYPAAAEISVNGQPAGIAHPVAPGDQLVFHPSANGADAVLFAEDLLTEASRGLVNLDGSLCRLGSCLLINGIPAASHQAINQYDKVETVPVTTAGGLFRYAGLDPETVGIFRSGQPLDSEEPLRNGDVLTTGLLPKELPQEVPNAESMPVKEETPAVPALTVELNGKPLQLGQKPDKTPYLFVDLLNYANIDTRNPPPGKKISLLVNGENASYLLSLHDGDRAVIRWE